MKAKFIVSHILLEQKFEAEDVLRKMDEGLSFKEAAMKFSKCSSARSGGTLGVFKASRFHESFSEAVELLPMDQVSKPVRTPFGYHLILKTPLTG